MGTNDEDQETPKFIEKIIDMKSEDEIEQLRQQIMPLILSDEPIYNPYQVIPYEFTDDELQSLRQEFPAEATTEQSEKYLQRLGLVIAGARRLHASQGQRQTNQEVRNQLQSLRNSASNTLDLFLELPPNLHFYIDFGLQEIFHDRQKALGGDVAPFVRRMDSHYSDVTEKWIDMLLSKLTDLALALDAAESHLKKNDGGNKTNIGMTHLSFRAAEFYLECFDKIPTTTAGKPFEGILEIVARIANIRDDPKAGVMTYVRKGVSNLKQLNEQRE